MFAVNVRDGVVPRRSLKADAAIDCRDVSEVFADLLWIGRAARRAGAIFWPFLIAGTASPPNHFLISLRSYAGRSSPEELLPPIVPTP
jgi:hypothetical protein